MNQVNFKSDVPNEFWLAEKVEYAKSRGRNTFGVPYISGTITGSFSGPVMIPVELLSTIPGERGEQNNVRQGDLERLKAEMTNTGRLPINDRGIEDTPFIEVAYDGSAWVNEGNHRIMAAAELGWKALPVEVRYFDGGERNAVALAPEKLLDRHREITMEQLAAKKLSQSNMALDEIPLVVTGRHIGPVVAIKDGVAIQDTGRGNMVGHDLSKFETPPKVGDKMDVSYKDGLAKMADALSQDMHAVSVSMHTR